MYLRELRIKNFKSIKDTKSFPVSRLLAFIGENNSGKSNIMGAIELLIGAGSGGISKTDFNNSELPIVITGKFSELTNSEKGRWQSYLVNSELILEKHLTLASDPRTGKEKVTGEFHGYKAEPTDWFLSLAKIESKLGSRPKWASIVEENNLPDYFLQDGKCNKTVFSKGLVQYLNENIVKYHCCPEKIGVNRTNNLK